MLKTQGDPTNPLVQTTLSIHFTNLYRENMRKLALLAAKCILLAKNHLKCALFGSFVLIFSLNPSKIAILACYLCKCLSYGYYINLQVLASAQTTKL
jgi:hypothetical protein